VTSQFPNWRRSVPQHAVTFAGGDSLTALQTAAESNQKRALYQTLQARREPNAHLREPLSAVVGFLSPIHRGSVTGQSIGTNNEAAVNYNEDVIRPLAMPILSEAAPPSSPATCARTARY
jgi:hypothetical protein